MVKSILVATAFFTAALGCAKHRNLRRQDVPPAGSREIGRTIPQDREHDWAYEASYNWGSLNSTYARCQTGSQQSPIPLQLTQGLSTVHRPDFSAYTEATGLYYNWGYGPAQSFIPGYDDPNRDEFNFTSLPAMSYDNITLYLRGWHIHAPADHTVAGVRSKAELHLVHADADGNDRAVAAIRLDPGNSNNTWFEQLPRPLIGFNELTTEETLRIDMRLALNAINNFSEFFTYEGSLTSPPCTEGLRWFLSREILFLGVDQMQELLGISTYSAREEQQVWQHRINA